MRHTSLRSHGAAPKSYNAILTGHIVAIRIQDVAYPMGQDSDLRTLDTVLKGRDAGFRCRDATLRSNYAAIKSRDAALRGQDATFRIRDAISEFML